MGWVKIADLKGEQGVPGPQGLPGVNATPADAAVAGYVEGPSATRTALVGTLGMPVPVQGAGIDPTGVSDSTSAIQAIIDANPGRLLQLPAGVFKISALTISKGQHLQGVGQQDWRDRATYFGDAQFLVNANFKGTVLRSTLTTTNPAILIVDGEVNSGGLSDLSLIGPGSGTSTGVVVGSGTWTVVNALFRNVKIANFSVGMRTYLVNEGSFYDLRIRGCGTTGLDIADQTNQNAFYMLDIETCGDGLKIAGNCVANAFYSPILQSNTGTGLICAGIKNAFYNPYFENNTTRALDVTATANGNTFHDSYFNAITDSVRIAAGAAGTNLTGFGDYVTAVPVSNAGNRTFLQGRFYALTDTGVGTVLIDSGTAGSAFGAYETHTPTVSGITKGNGTAVTKYTTIGKRVTGEITFTVGSTTVMTGLATFTLPFPAANAANGRPGTAALCLNQGDNWYFADSMITNTTVVVGLLNYTTRVLGPFTSTTPFSSWNTGDVLTVNFDYERA